MIKNILYSLLLHSTFAFLIYANFHHTIHDTIDLKDGVVVGIVSWQDVVSPTKIVENPKIIEKKVEAKPDVKKKKPKVKPKKKTEPKAKIIKTEEKSDKKTDKKSATKPLIEDKAQFKKTEEKEKPQEKTENTKEEKPQEKDEKVEEVKPEETVEEDKKPEEELEVDNPVVNNSSTNDVQDLENLQLSAREKFNIQSQLKTCYSRALTDVPKSNFIVIVKVIILEDGTIDFNEDKIIDVDRYNNPKELDYKNRIDSVIRALELCSPLRNMPSDKYDIWREFTIEFGGE